MNRKYVIYSMLTVFLTVFQSSFAMHGNLFKLARLIGITTVPVYGLYDANKTEKKRDKWIKKLPLIEEKSIENWFEGKKKKLHISNAELISLRENDNNSDWATCREHIVAIAKSDKSNLNVALLNSLNNEIDEDQKDKDQKVIAKCSMLLKHELGHIVHKDNRNILYSLIAIPISIEALSFGINSYVRKVFNIQQPKTLMQSALRSCFAISNIGPKILLNEALIITLSRYQETQADKFACEHAESRLELEEFEKFFSSYKFSDSDLKEWIKYKIITEDEATTLKNRTRMQMRWADAKSDRWHPARIDRREMVENYLAQWDAKHGNRI